MAGTSSVSSYFVAAVLMRGRGDVTTGQFCQAIRRSPPDCVTRTSSGVSDTSNRRALTSDTGFTLASLMPYLYLLIISGVR